MTTKTTMIERTRARLMELVAHEAMRRVKELEDRERLVGTDTVVAELPTAGAPFRLARFVAELPADDPDLVQIAEAHQDHIVDWLPSLDSMDLLREFEESDDPAEFLEKFASNEEISG
jgi:hypothetical protein